MAARASARRFDLDLRKSSPEFTSSVGRRAVINDAQTQ